jgi:hypothetical protein
VGRGFVVVGGVLVVVVVGVVVVAVVVAVAVAGTNKDWGPQNKVPELILEFAWCSLRASMEFSAVLKKKRANTLASPCKLFPRDSLTDCDWHWKTNLAFLYHHLEVS